MKLLHGFLEAALKPATCAGITFVEVKAVSLVRELAASLLRGQAGHAKRPFASACVTLAACFDMFPIVVVRGALKWDLSKNLVFCPNQVDPHPPPRKLGHPKLKKKIDVFFAF